METTATAHTARADEALLWAAYGQPLRDLPRLLDMAGSLKP